MPSSEATTYNVNLDFEIIKLPPVTDILILGRKVPQGKFGVLHSFELISPDVFSLIEIDKSLSETVEAVIVNKSLLKKLPEATILEILSTHVFPFVSGGEAVRVNFNVQIFRKNIRGVLNES
jgi:hypothetical protein